MEGMGKLLVETIVASFGKEALAFYLQGSMGPCPCCGCSGPPHKNDCEFVREAKEALKGAS